MEKLLFKNHKRTRLFTRYKKLYFKIFGKVRVKRCASSPLTPKTPNPVASKDISGVNSKSRKSRKQLKLEPDEPVPDGPKVEPDLPIMNDHGYVHVTVS